MTIYFLNLKNFFKCFYIIVMDSENPILFKVTKILSLFFFLACLIIGATTTIFNFKADYADDQ